MKKALITALGVACALALLAGCGGGSDSTTGASSGSGSVYGGGSSGTDTSSSTASTASVDDGIVSADDNADLGQILVTSGGMTLYYFEKDSGTTSSCNGACAATWPPLLTKSGNPQAQGAAMRSKLATTKRDDGTTQVTYAGHPLYTYVADTAPGDTTGNDISQFGADWYALTPAGEEPK